MILIPAPVHTPIRRDFPYYLEGLGRTSTTFPGDTLRDGGDSHAKPVPLKKSISDWEHRPDARVLTVRCPGPHTVREVRCRGDAAEGRDSLLYTEGWRRCTTKKRGPDRERDRGDACPSPVVQAIVAAPE